uniref:RPN13_C domain-containing protein n=2 Tax=Macrostomum lignano TaxID=282301 RepID=A0A1I8INS4_9PLAT
KSLQKPPRQSTMSHALFAGSGGSVAPASRYLVEFKAGKMTLQDGWVRPINKKGMVYVHQSDDNLMHFCWKDRTSGLVEDDLIIFPDDCEFKRVTQCTTGRVYLLKFKSSSKKYFFWMQEPKEDKDADLCKKVNDSLNNPPQPGSGRAGGGGAASAGGIGGAGGGSGSLSSALSGLGESELSSMFGNISQSELMQLLQMGMQMGLSPSGMMRPASTGAGSTASDGASEAPTGSSVPSRVQSSPGVRPAGSGANSAASGARQTMPERPATAAASAGGVAAGSGGGRELQQTPLQQQQRTAGGRIQLSDLQTILTSIQAPEGAAPASAGSAGAQFDLNDALPIESLLPLLADAQLQARLMPFLPDSPDLPRSVDELRRSVQSPQFRQCVSAFAAALRTGELGPLVAQFGVGEAAVQAANEGNAEAFMRALQQPKPTAAAAAAEGSEDVEMAASAAKPDAKDEEKMDES